MPVLLRGSQGYCESQIFSFFKKPLQVLGVTIEQMMALVQGLSFRPPQPPLPRKLSLLFPLRISRGSSQGGQDAGTHHSDQAPRRPSLRGTGGPAPSFLRPHGSRARGHLHRVPHCPPPAPHPHCPREVVLFLGGQPAEGALGPGRLLGSAIESIFSSAWRSTTTLTVAYRGTDTPGHGGRAQSRTPRREMTSLGSEGEVQPFL